MQSAIKGWRGCWLVKEKVAGFKEGKANMAAKEKVIGSNKGTRSKRHGRSRHQCEAEDRGTTGIRA
jgi:hypothetical protein